MTIISTTNAEHYKWGDGADGWHLLRSDELSVIEEEVPPGTAEVRHYHRQSQQFFYVLCGVVYMELEGEKYEIHAGQGLHVPAGKVHKMKNESDQSVRFLVISQPKSHGDKVSAG